MFLEKVMTQAEITASLELGSEKLVKTWVYQYHREGVAAFNKPTERPSIPHKCA